MSKKTVNHKELCSVLKVLCLLAGLVALVPSGFVSASWALDVWDGSVAEGYEGGDGSSDGPYLIKTGGQLSRLAREVSAGTDYTGKHFRLVDDIDLAERNWTPVGYRENDPSLPFCAAFDGGGHRISRMRISGNIKDAGLFAYTKAGFSVKNLNLEEISIDISCSYYASSAAGGVVGYNDRGTVADCTSKGSIAAASSSYSFAGGLVGYNNNGTVTGCSFYGSVATSSSYYPSFFASAGGIAGGNSGRLSGCKSGGSVFATSSSFGSTARAGGVVGSNNGTVTDCSAAGGVRATFTGNKGSVYVGGVIGMSDYRDAVISENKFSAAGTGQKWGIGLDGRLSPTGPSNNGTVEGDID
ncbi:MAG: hypothetical protein LBP21_07300 [Synergistaceae bacterium]|jgi:hypothetical protein|nr:hypothetical protein [Synergistaceae bacterium]